MINDRSHPLKHLRQIVRKLGRNFNYPVDEELLEIYQHAAGHRVDEDLTKAYDDIVKSEFIKKMPTSGEFRAACGIPRRYRDGSRPE